MEEAYFSVVKYVADRVRYEPKNIGLILHVPNKGVIRHAFDSGAARGTKLESTIIKSYINQIELFLDENGGLFGEPSKPDLLCDVRKKYSESPIEVSVPLPCVSADVDEDIDELFSRFVRKSINRAVISAGVNTRKQKFLLDFTGILHGYGLIARDRLRYKFDVSLADNEVLKFDYGYGDRHCPKLLVELAVVSGDINNRLREIGTPLTKFDFLKSRQNTKTAAVLAYPKGSSPGEERELLGKYAERIFSVSASPMADPSGQVGEVIEFFREVTSFQTVDA